MRSSTLLTALLTISVASFAGAMDTPANAQPKPVIQIPKGIAGTWVGKSTTGLKDSVITTTTLVATADGKGWTEKLGDRVAMPVRILAAGGDSVVMEVGPYASILRPGVQVTTRSVTHFKGDNSWGTFQANYANAYRDVLKGKTSATRK